jgi:predicted transglutaminase-like cysteine proteinase
MVFENASPDRLRGTFQSAGLFLYPEPDAGLGEGGRLDRDGMRLLAAVLRVLLRSAYRGGDRAVEVVLQLDPAGELDPSSDPSGVRRVKADAPYDRRATQVGIEDAIVFLDAQDGGNGATRAIARDGIGPLLLGAWAFLRNSEAECAEEDTRWRWWLLFDESAPEDDDDIWQLEQVGEATAREFWGRVAPRVESWLAARFAPAVQETFPTTVEPRPRLTLVVDAAGDAYKKHGVFDPEAVRELWETVLGRKLPTKAESWEAKDLDAIFEWMHATIAYERDNVVYGKEEHVATVPEVLKNSKGDCEDMALLFASFAHHLGARTRAVLIPGHALCQIAIGDRSAEKLIEEILGLSARRARKIGLAPNQHPNFQATVTEGWKQPWGPGKGFERDAQTMTYFEWVDPTVEVTTDPDGSRWLCVDEAQSRILGGVDTYRRGEQTVLREDGTWEPGTRFIEYKTSEEAVEVFIAKMDSGGDATSPRKPNPVPPRAPALDRTPRAPRREDLGVAVPESVPQSALVWRRHRWTFGNDRTRRREYVLDIACAEEWLASVRPPLRIVMPSLDPATGVPPRVLERARQAVEAIELARPSLEAVSLVLRDLLTRSRRDEDTEADERERAFDLVQRFVHNDALRPYVGKARDRVQAVVLTLATGTADTWGRTLLQAELQRALIENTTLIFDHRGWPSLERDGGSDITIPSGRWKLALQSTRLKS